MDEKKTYSVFEETDDPMENMGRRNKKFIFYIFCFFLLGVIFIEYARTMPSQYTGKEEYYEIQNLQIPTLYQYTEFSDIFLVNEIKDFDNKNMKSEYVVVYYNTVIPDELKDNYRENLHELSYTKLLYNERELYVLNSDDNSKFKYVMIGDTQVKYGVCVSGPYEEVLQ